ncbi:MAG: hypothetical protein ACI841_002329 [Planctomycetota bacterium]|jgi:hypothetical protein
MTSDSRRASLILILLCCFGAGAVLDARDLDDVDPFRQLDEWLPSPNRVRTASGAPGDEYWQQRADYVIDVEIDDDLQHLHGSETITYSNNSPDGLDFLWVQLDANIFGPQSHSALSSGAPDFNSPSYKSIRNMMFRAGFDGACKIEDVRTAAGDKLHHKIVDTMMRIDLPETLENGSSTSFKIDWNYSINPSEKVRGRTGCEFFEDDNNWLYELAHWFPRMAAYTDYGGWQNDQFLGRGEFTLEFGNYLVRITVPNDHVVASTGTLQNPTDVLTTVEMERLESARTAKEPMYIRTPEEALSAETGRPTGLKTWIFEAENVRDFAFATSRKFIWDAMGVDIEGSTVMAMSFFPKEGDPLWSRYSTHAVAHTLEVYSERTIPYPYPVAISVNGPVGGMEYPMICFNGPRPEEDGTYSQRTKYGLIGVVIHEVGHNWFPMIINSDERNWTWMDEGLNTFMQVMAEREWEHDYPTRRGEASSIVGYMKSSEQMPIMTNSESILQFGNNAYAKPASALNILRETVMGRELFDFAFKTYAQRWAFKRPEPADLFRTMEDASAIDLDWFWRGWFYTTGHTNQALTGITRYSIDTRDPEVEKALDKEERDAEPKTITQLRNEGIKVRTDDFPDLIDFYNEFDKLDITAKDLDAYQKHWKSLDDEDRELLESSKNFYVIDVENRGDLVMPVILEVNYKDGTTEELRIPVDIWRKEQSNYSRLHVSDKLIDHVVLDPYLETADIDRIDNVWPPQIPDKRFQMRKKTDRGKNPMQDAIEAEKKAAAEASAKSDEEAAVEATAAESTAGTEEAKATEGMPNSEGR